MAMNDQYQPNSDSILKKLGEIFGRHRKELFVVGGAVRDRLLGRESYDLDFATDALPNEIKRLAALAKPQSMYTVGEKFGTIGLVFDGRTVEITTFRAEQYVPRSRKPTVTFGASLQGDLSRRDFTINAIAYDVIRGELLDPFGGIRDLRAGLIRAVGDPAQRFDEDPLRLLRAVRFAAQLGFAIDPQTSQAIVACKDRLRTVSQERIAEELNKILLSPNPAYGARLLVNLGLAEVVLPEIMPMVGLDQGEYHHKDVFEHTLGVLENTPPDLALRWTALLHDIGKPATKAVRDGRIHFYGHEMVGADMAREALTRLKMDNRTINKVVKLVRMHMRGNLYEPDWTDGAVRRLIREAGDEFDELLMLSRADITSHRPQKVEAALSRVDELEERAARLIEQENVRQLSSPLDGHELMAIFKLPPGPWIREVKEFLLAKVLDGELAPDDKGKAEEYAREFMRQRAA
ncbi:MAG: CCA tRNA nucleotidyltransferase [Chloroflexota bacterium]